MIPHSRPFLREEEAAAAARVVRSGMLAQGSEVAAFEAECAGRVGRRHGVAVSSGTAALHLALEALGMPADAPVAIPAYACAALPSAVAMAGREACLVDAAEDGAMRVDAIPARVGAVLLPHLFGKACPLPEAVAPVIEDIAQSIGGATGRRGILAVASFYATKMLTTGEGGMVLTDDDGLAGEIRDRRDYDKRGDGLPRFNYKMTDVQAAIGRVQLGRLEGFVARRRAIAAHYLEAWQGLPLGMPAGGGHVYYRFVVRIEQGVTANSPAFMAFLHERGIDAKAPVHPPGPLPPGFDGAARAYGEFVSIPLYPALSKAEEKRILEAVAAFFG